MRRSRSPSRMAVTWPEAGNIGGGGFMMVAPPGKDADLLRVPRNRAGRGEGRSLRRRQGDWLNHKAAGVPGTVRGLALAHQKFGKLPWKDVVMPAVKLAEKASP